MIETNGNKLVFCCAKGEFRGPAASEMVKGSDFVEGGYTGLYNWLRDKSTDEQISDIRMFYSGTSMILIADEPDLARTDFAESLTFVSSLLARAQIDFVQHKYQNLVCKIASKERINVFTK
jgi:hypothetical protein